MSEHTPGPWHVHQSKLGTVLSPKDETVALVGGDVDGSPVANARLIAAAPALLAALEAILDVLKPDSLGYLQGDVNLLTCEHMIQAREAIKEVKGE